MAHTKPCSQGMASIALTVIGCIDYLAYGSIFTRAMFRPKKSSMFFSAKKSIDDRREVVIGQDSCYRSLYVIECSLIDHIPELGHTLVPLIWLFWSDHT